MHASGQFWRDLTTQGSLANDRVGAIADEDWPEPDIVLGGR